MLKTFTLQTHTREELVDITSQVRETVSKILKSENKDCGVAIVYTKHTTSGLTIN